MTATPGQPPDLYTRWWRKVAGEVTDTDITSAWQMTFPADREFWTELDGVTAERDQLREAYEQQRLQLLQARGEKDDLAARADNLRGRLAAVLDKFTRGSDGYRARLSGLVLKREYRGAGLPVPDRLSYLEDQ